MSSEVIESVLFGMEDSAGEVHRIGCLEKAYQGTIYINEVVDIPHDIQDKILSAIIQQKFKRVNGKKSIALDVRIISSTSVNPHNYIVKKLLREDLYYRLAVVPILVPSLVERKEDILLLVEHLIYQICRRVEVYPRRISDDAMAILQNYDWPGNVRELKSYLEKVIFLCVIKILN